MIILKQYQETALSILSEFLTATRSTSVVDAYRSALAKQGRFNETYSPIFGDAPSVCLRIPTGGGKTIMAAHAVAIAGKTILDSDTPIALWLTPSDTIRTQTLEALAKSNHPYRQALAQYFGDRIRICDLESLQTINSNDVGNAAIIVVATIQAFNITDTTKRNVYSFFEDLAPHFEGLSSDQAEGLERVTEADIVKQPYLTSKDLGRIKSSVANWMHMHRPIVIIDEAHNNRTDRFFGSLGRINPSCVIEMTATPVQGNNVLYHVSAAELRAEQMIKLPIVLAEHPDGWRECLRDAILTRNRLELLSQNEEDYVRPLVLVQAQPKGGEAIVDVVRQYLIDEEGIPETQIAVATGVQKELDGIDLFDRATEIRYVITVEALKEGWDCSFAYVLASLQSVTSSKDVEQLLGRVLRMPYAKNRIQDALNRAYAHIVAENFAQAASTLKDRLVQNMGFERLETASIIVPQVPLGLLGGGGERPAGFAGGLTIPDSHIELTSIPDSTAWPAEVIEAIQVIQTTQGATVLIPGSISSETLARTQEAIISGLTPKARENVNAQFNDIVATRRALKAPAQLGLNFASIPQLCLIIDDHLEVVERATLSQIGDWNLLDHEVQLAGFSITETIHSFEIDMDGTKVVYRRTQSQNLLLQESVNNTTEQDLCLLYTSPSPRD